MAQFYFNTSDLKDSEALAKAFNANTLNRDPDTGKLKSLGTTQARDNSPQRSMTTYSMSEIMQGSAITKPQIASYDAFNQVLSGSLAEMLGDPKANPNIVLGNQKVLVPNDILAAAGSNAATLLSGAGGINSTGGVAPAPNDKVAIVLAEARKQIGKPYIWGAAGPDNFDCSGLVMWCWAAAGVKLPHYSGSQYDVTEHIDMNSIQPGDLIFYESPAKHVTIYAGNNEVINAPHTGGFVRVDSIDYWKTTKLASRVRP